MRGNGGRGSGHPLISIVMPVYNAQHHLESALDSALNQDIRSLQLICVDDGSTDDSQDILNRAAARDDRITIVSQPNSGVSAARNNGIEHAAGDFICFMDSDDLYASRSSLRSLYEEAILDHQLVAGGSFANYRGKGKIEDEFADPVYSGYTLRNAGVIRYSDYQFDFGFHRFIFSKELFDRGAHRFPRLDYYEDPVFLAAILHDASSFGTVSEPTYLYRCDFKPIHWTTEKTMDLLEGVKRNLVFSRERGYAKLHWYTARHLDEASWYCGVGLEAQLDIDAIDRKLQETETELDHGLLASVEPEDASFVPLLRKRIQAARISSPMRRSLASAEFKLKKTLAPLAHRLKS